MLYNGIFGSHGNICYVILINAVVRKVHSIDPVNVCTNFEINRYKIDEFRPCVYLTSRDPNTSGYFRSGTF